MSRPAAFPEPMEPLAATTIATKTGTSHTVQTVVDRTNKKVKLSDTSLHMKNGDTVIWHPAGLDALDKLVIKFTASKHTGAAGGSVSVDITEEVGSETVTMKYSLAFVDKDDGNEKDLTYDGLTSALTDEGPTLVVDDMPPPIHGTLPGDGGGGGHHHGRRPR